MIPLATIFKINFSRMVWNVPEKQKEFNNDIISIIIILLVKNLLKTSYVFP